MGLEKFQKEQYDLLEKKLIKHCERILIKAVDSRSAEKDAHNFTGNLINSIVVGLFRQGELVVFMTPAQEGLAEPPIRKKMTYPLSYYFSESSKHGLDYDQTRPSSYYEPELVAGMRLGNEDAKRFIRSYKPDPKAIFQIVVGYTTEYASFVETQRRTTGYMQTVEWVQMHTHSAIQ